MNVLDDLSKFKETDRSGMLALVENFPDMMKEAAGIFASSGMEDRGPVSNIVISGMGGSAISGDIASKLLFSSSGVPVVVSRGYDIPAFVSERTLFFALSYSGNTEETLSSFEKASAAGQRL